jgi:SAM-dependent methyltransferase
MAREMLYDVPKYYDIAFSWDVSEEIDLLELCFENHMDFPVKRVLEPGCGTGRLMVGLARRGYEVRGYDLAESMVALTRDRVREAGLSHLAKVEKADMVTARFRRGYYHGAVNAIESIGYLLEDDQILAHLRNTGDALKKGGVYVVSLSCAWDDLYADEWEIHWNMKRDGVKVRIEWDVESQDYEKKLSRNVCRMRVNDHGRHLEFEEHHELRLWLLDEWKDLIRRSGCFELVGIYDENHEMLPLDSYINGEMGCLTYALKRI